MIFLDKIKNLDYKIDKSKVAQSLAQAFLVGFVSTVAILIGPDLNNPALLLKEFVDKAWLFMFFNSCLGAALSASIGLYIKSAFDKPITTITTTSVETTTITPATPNNK